MQANEYSSRDELLKRFQAREQAKLRVYIAAAPGAGKTYRMLEEAHRLKREGIDIVIGVIETHGRADTKTMVGDLECIPMSRLHSHGVVVEEMDVEAIIRRRPAVVIVDELAYSNKGNSRNKKRYQDVLDLLNNGISVNTAVNIQHLESLNELLNTMTDVREREMVPDHMLRRANEIVTVDAPVETLLSRRWTVWSAHDIEILRELALAQVEVTPGCQA